MNSFDHNAATFDDHLEAIEREGSLRVCHRRALAGLRDDRLQRMHRLVLWALLSAMNDMGVAWPGRDWIADRCGIAVKTVSNALYDLRDLGYIDWTRRATPESNGRTLTNYFIPQATTTYEDLIEQYVHGLRENALPAGQKSALPAGQFLESTPPAGQSDDKVPCPQGKKVPCPQGNSNVPTGTTVVRSQSSSTVSREETYAHSPNGEAPVSGPDLFGSEPVATDADDGEVEKTYPQDFEAFWSECAIKRGKWAAYAKSWKRLKPAERKAATEGMRLYAARVKREQIDHPKWPQGWLTDRRWEDELARAAPAQSGPWWQRRDEVAAITDERWRAGIAQYANGIWPEDKLGPPPGHEECVVPRHIVDELRLTDVYDRAGIKRGYIRYD